MHEGGFEREKGVDFVALKGANEVPLKGYNRPKALIFVLNLDAILSKGSLSTLIERLNCITARVFAHGHDFNNMMATVGDSRPVQSV